MSELSSAASLNPLLAIYSPAASQFSDYGPWWWTKHRAPESVYAAHKEGSRTWNISTALMLNRLNNAVLHSGKNATQWDNNQLFLKFRALTANVWGVALIKQWMIQLGGKKLVKYMDGNKSSCCICGRGYGWIFYWAWQWFERSHQSNGSRSAREKEDTMYWDCCL